MSNKAFKIGFVFINPLTVSWGGMFANDYIKTRDVREYLKERNESKTPRGYRLG